MIEKAVWAGTRHNSFAAAAESMQELAECPVSAKQVRRITAQVGEDRVAERREQVAAFTNKTLMERTTPNSDVQAPDVGALMLDNGMHQRRDHFGEQDAKTHWKQETGGLALSMSSEMHEEDPCPECPEWLFESEAVAEIAGLAQRRETPEKQENRSSHDTEDGSLNPDGKAGFDWTPRLLSREVIASTEGTDIARHLEWVAWKHGITAASRQAFVADGASWIWSLHKRYFSQMTGILDLMHALSYAYRAAATLDEEGLYRRWARAIWQGRVADVLTELQAHQQRLGFPPPDASADDPRQRVARAITYYTHHQTRMNYPEYRRLGLPITSSLMESTIKQLNQRVKGTEKYWNHVTAEAILQLRADTLSDSRPLQSFWNRWLNGITGMNRYRVSA